MNELKHIQNEAITSARLWAGFVKKNKNSIWSKQQADFINAAVINSRNSLLTKEIYLKAKNKLNKFLCE